MNVENALVAIAALGGVVWTGGSIVRQLYPSYLTIVLQSGMEAVMFAALAAVAGLFLSGLVLQGTAFAFFLLYEYGYVRDLMVLYNINAGITPVPANIPDVPRYLNDMYSYTRLEGFLLLPYVIVVFWPTQYAIAWTAFVLLYLGYQMMLNHLNNAKPDTTATQFGLAQVLGLSRLYETLQEISALLKQKL